MCKKISVLGSTGSIGVQTLEVAENLNYQVVSLSAGGNNINILEQQVRRFKPKTVSVFFEQKAKELKQKIADTNVKVLAGENGVIESATENSADIVLNSIVGIAGLKPTVEAIKSKKTIALANKETMVTGGKLVTDLAKQNNVKILPVDSEHSAIFQCLQGNFNNKIEKIILTASGGPFFEKQKQDLVNITPKDALKHPNWDMGAKITIDSATLMNKGLEVIEAVHLFDVDVSKIQVLVHRQSIIHSAIEFEDGAIIAQLGAADMRLPIQYALTYPNRTNCVGKKLDLTAVSNLTFAKPDTNTFTCLATCIEAIKEGKLKPVAANGANEMAVKLFLEGKIGFLNIGELVKAAVDNQKTVESFDFNDIFEADKTAREFVLSKVK